MKRALTLLAASLAPMAACAQSANSGDGGLRSAVNSIVPDDIAHRIGVIADDSMRGRETPSPGLETTAAYIAGEFRRFGLTPGGDDGSYLQRFPIGRQQLDLARSKVVVSGGATWHMGPDVILHRGTAGDSGLTGQAVVIAGSTGDLDPAVLAAVRDAVVLLAAPLAAAGNFVGSLREAGAAAVILVTTRSDSRWTAMRRNVERSRWEKGWLAAEGAPVLEVRETTVRTPLAQHGYDLSAHTRPGSRYAARTLPNLTLTITTALTRDTASAPNVVGILEGSDPALAQEYIVFSAHMDHVGVGRPINGDSIYNGADDDASGTVAIIEAAEAFALLSPRPRRSMVFLTVSGEEHGMWGSEYFSAHPPFPLSQVVANLNADMVGRNWRDTIVVIGKEHSDLGTTLARVARAHPELDMTPIDDPWPQERFYYRSDHINFARNGVPILFFFNGTHADYHRPSDHPDLIDAEKAARIVKLMFYLGLEIANATERPQWDPESYDAIVGGSRER